MKEPQILLLIALLINLTVTRPLFAEMYEWGEEDDALVAKIEKDCRDNSKMEKILNDMQMDYASLMDGVNPAAVDTLTDALAGAGIMEVYILDRRGVDHIKLALTYLESKLLYSSDELDLILLSKLIEVNSVHGAISCMDLGTVIMQYLIAGGKI